nr:hypothetical protein [uncultured archaeon]
MTLDTIVNISGNLKDAYKAAVAGTLRHVDELMNERRTTPTTPERDNLRNLWFYTGDGELYFVDGKTPKLAMTREADNLVLRHIDDAFTQLTSSGNYRPDRAEADAAIKASTTEIFDLTELKLQKRDTEYSRMEVSTTKYDQLNTEQRRLAERVYGKGDDFVANMAMLKVAGIQATNIYVLNPEYVKANAKDSPVARASWLIDFGCSSGFSACGRGISSGGRVRGVRGEVVREADAPENGAVPSAPVVPSEIRTPTLAETLAVSRPYVPDVAWKAFEVDIGKLYKP